MVEAGAAMAEGGGAAAVFVQCYNDCPEEVFCNALVYPASLYCADRVGVQAG